MLLCYNRIMNDLLSVEKLNSAEALPRAKGDFEVICFIQKGELVCGKSGEVRTDIAAGEVAVIPPLTPHFAVGNVYRAVLGTALLPVKSVTVLHGQSASDVFGAVESAHGFYERSGAHGQAVLSAFGNLICTLIVASVGQDGFSPAVKAVVDDIENNVGDAGYSLENFIRSLPLNYDYVRKLFKKEVGATPHEYLMRARMERARSILTSGVSNRYSDYTVSQIAEACGFSEPLYFSRVFKKYFGVAPSYYQKNEE